MSVFTQKRRRNVDAKWFLKSKTLIGVVLSVLPAMLPALGISFGADDSMLINELMDSIIQLTGAALAVYGRWVAKAPMSLKP